MRATSGAAAAARLYAALGTLARPKWRRFVLVAALALAAPSAICGFALDDYVLLHELAQPDGNEWAGRAPFDLFRWVDPDHQPRLSDGAGLPWWTFEGAKLAFLRPVSSLTHALDHALWPRSALMMHVHNLFWFAVLLVLASSLYAELIESRWAAGVATAMYALDSTHAYPIGWISNRNALIGGAFGVATLLLHHRQRLSGGIGAALAAWLCFALSLLSVELALAVPGYLLAYALCLERGRVLPRVGSRDRPRDREQRIRHERDDPRQKAAALEAQRIGQQIPGHRQRQLDREQAQRKAQPRRERGTDAA